MHSSITFLAAALTSVAAKTIIVDAGQGGLVFTPDSTTADVGDVLEFHFFGSTHTVVQGDFSTPCQMGSLAGTAFNSGPIDNQANGAGNVFQVTVQNTNPIWYYCGTPSHCQNGMVGVINPPSSGDTLASYKSAAAGTSSSQLLSTVVGGVVVPVPVAGSSSTSSSTSAGPTTAASSTTSSPPSSSESSAAASSSTAAASTSSESSPTTATTAEGSSTVSSQATSSQAVSVSNSTLSTAITSPTLPVTSGGIIETAQMSMLRLVMLGLGFVIVFMV